ncbi:glycerophosphodiester phosphodiesterase family protein [Sphingobacterium bovistauri]|uniref:Glycerophosphodiester phosphodiesterase n=1 Tax=Sphingobacterium bovistauri TaxID=2781959 RepID=A0ABS7Z6K5_9SPHI|nr:glycerophosphodiester phosphodiesterase family protein [Sphingobacterium bovistauri]MCA5005036.1 glycerophosphodiester phosphodiesterase [Sphingobacterium bovistauri]
MKKTTLFAVLIIFSVTTFAQSTKIVAHRGAWKNTKVPQNSIAALKHAIDQKVWGTEFDVVLAKDDVLVVNHDNDYQGTDIANNDYATLSQKKLSNGEKLPTAEEYMREGLKQKKTKMIFEIKPSLLGKERSKEAAELAYKLVKDLKGLKQTVFISFSYDACLHLKKLDKKVRVQFLGSNKSPSDLYKDGFNEMDFNYNVFKNNPSYIPEAKKHKMKVNVWTVNKEEEMRYFIDQKVEYITTDEPELLKKILKK